MDFPPRLLILLPVLPLQPSRRCTALGRTPVEGRGQTPVAHQFSVPVVVMLLRSRRRSLRGAYSVGLQTGGLDGMTSQTTTTLMCRLLPRGQLPSAL